LILLYANFTKL